MEIHVEPIVFTVRLFGEGRSFANKDDPFEAVMTVQRMGSIAFVSGLHGNLSRAAHRLMLRKFKEMGIEKYYCSRGEEDVCKLIR